MLPIAHLWLLAVIPIGFAIIPISELTIVLLLVLAADVAVGFLLGEDLQLRIARHPRTQPGAAKDVINSLSCIVVLVLSGQVQLCFACQSVCGCAFGLHSDH